MLFSELYSAYYNAVAAILRDRLTNPGEKTDLRAIAEKYAFGESFRIIEESLKNGNWALLNGDGTTPIQNIPEMPLTTLQKQWLKAVFADPRIRLFTDILPEFGDVEPLFTPGDVRIFDRYNDGDPYSDENYIRHFRLILNAAKNRYPLKFAVKNKKGKLIFFIAQPDYIEYSEKDDKFRVFTSGCRFWNAINIGKIEKCMPARSEPKEKKTGEAPRRTECVVMEVTDERNTLERVLLHFAHFEKEAERMDEKHYRVRVRYEADDETEIVIRILSFGPFVKATEPERFTELIKNRLKSQKSCEFL